MRKMILRDLAVASVLCLAERMLERLLFPGLHRLPDRMAAIDPTRVDDLATVVAEALGLFAIVSLFNFSLYAISFLSRRPLKPHATLLVTSVILVLTLAGAFAQYATMPVPKVADGSSALRPNVSRFEVAPVAS
jgi:hypothetical protein